MGRETSWPKRHRRAILKWLILVIAAGIAVAIDLLTKHLAEQSLVFGESRKILSFFYLERTANSGVAFGLFGGHTWEIVAMNAVAFVLILAFVTWWRSLVVAGVAGGLIIGGFLGNMVQRVSGEHTVVDFLKFPGWPNFNMADVFLVLGICVIVLGLSVEMIRTSKAGGGINVKQ